MTKAENGLEAFKIVKNNLKDGIHYPLIVLDLNMPEMNGFETAECINCLYKDYIKNQQNGILRRQSNEEIVQPVIIACSASNITNVLRNNCNKKGISEIF